MTSPRLRPLSPHAFFLVALLTGCGPSQESFDAEFATQYCALQFECEDPGALAALGWADEDACVAQMSTVDTGAEFDRKAAKECLAAIESVTCDDLAENTFPQSCAEVE